MNTVSLTIKDGNVQKARFTDTGYDLTLTRKGGVKLRWVAGCKSADSHDIDLNDIANNLRIPLTDGELTRELKYGEFENLYEIIADAADPIIEAPEEQSGLGRSSEGDLADATGLLAYLGNESRAVSLCTDEHARGEFYAYVSTLDGGSPLEKSLRDDIRALLRFCEPWASGYSYNDGASDRASGYDANTFYMEVEPKYGTLADLRSLLDTIKFPDMDNLHAFGGPGIAIDEPNLAGLSRYAAIETIPAPDRKIHIIDMALDRELPLQYAASSEFGVLVALRDGFIPSFYLQHDGAWERILMSNPELNVLLVLQHDESVEAGGVRWTRLSDSQETQLAATGIFSEPKKAFV